MRVLLVHDYGTPHGGAEIMSILLRDGLRARGHEARLFTSDAAPLPLAIEADDCCPGSTGVARRFLQAANPMAAAALRRLLRRFRPDVVHLRMFMTQLSPSILPVLRDVPVVLHVVNHDLVCPLTTRILPDGRPCPHRPGWACGRAGCVSALGVARTLVQQRRLRRGLPAADRVVANSWATRQVLEANGIAVHTVVWNGVPDRPARPPLGGPPLACVVGRLVPEKGVDVLLEAWRAVRCAVPEAQLLVAGDGPARRPLEDRAAGLGLDGSVRFIGHLLRPELETVLDRAWVQVVPSRWAEPFGLVAAEALMRGTAVVASDTGGLAELVEHDVTGLRVPPGEPVPLAAALIALLSDPARAEQLGGAGRAFAQAELGQALMLDRFLDIYADLLPATRVHG